MRKIKLQALQMLKFDQIDVLVVCGANVAKLREFVRVPPANLIFVNLQQNQDEVLYDAYQRLRIQEQYCASFVVEFTKRLLLLEGP